MASSSFVLLNRLHIKGVPSLLFRQGNFSFSENIKSPIRRNSSRGLTTKYNSHCLQGIAPNPSEISLLSKLDIFQNPLGSFEIPQNLKTEIPETSHAVSQYIIQRMILVGDLDPETSKLAIGILGPFLSIFAFLFIVRIVMSWYPKLPVGKFPYVIAYAPTEPILIPTRKLIPPLGGVDVTPVVWFGLISFLNEILLGPQGLLVLLSQKV